MARWSSSRATYFISRRRSRILDGGRRTTRTRSSGLPRGDCCCGERPRRGGASAFRTSRDRSDRWAPRAGWSSIRPEERGPWQGPGAFPRIRRPPAERTTGMPRRVLIMGAAGRDFHNFNVVYRDDPATEVVAVTAVRTGVGKSQTTRAIAEALKAAGKRVVAVRHPMPYGDLATQRVQRYAELADLDRYDCTIEEREEYEPHIMSGTVIYAGVDYGAILQQAQAECDVLLWDGGNNDLPFYRPTVWITLVDPLRAGHELRYHPGETNLRAAGVVLINKMDSATPEQVAQLEGTVAEVNRGAVVVKANSKVTCDDPDAVRGKRVLVVEDGPTLTHGGMKIGAGVIAAQRLGAAEIVDPRPWAIGTIAETFEKYDVGAVLPAMGYSDGQLDEMSKIIDAADVDLVVIGTPIDLRRVIDIRKPAVRVRYDLEVLPDSPQLADILSPVV